MVLVLAFDRVTVKLAVVVPLFPSVTLTSLIVIDTASSSLIVPTPWASVIVALTALVRLTLKVSFPSSSVSPLTVTAIVWLVWPAVKVRVPDLVT